LSLDRRQIFGATPRAESAQFGRHGPDRLTESADRPMELLLPPAVPKDPHRDASEQPQKAIYRCKTAIWLIQAGDEMVAKKSAPKVKEKPEQELSLHRK